MQAVRLGTTDYLDTFKKLEEEAAGGTEERVPVEPPFIEEMRESLLLCWHAVRMHFPYTTCESVHEMYVAHGQRPLQTCLTLPEH